MGSIHEWKKSRDSEKIKEKDDKWVEWCNGKRRMKQEEKYQKWKLCEKGYIYTHDYYILFLLTMTKTN